MKKNIFFYFLTIFLILNSCKAIEETAEANRARNSLSTKDNSDNAIKAIHGQNFVLEAESVMNKRGQSVFVTSNTNFISVSGDKATIQLNLNQQLIGPNGIGGITLDGTISDPKITINKKGVLFYTMQVQGVGISATVTFTMPKGTNKCKATITPNFNSNAITFSGYVYPTKDSNIFKGRAI